MSKRDELIENLKQQLDALNHQIDRFEAKAHETSGEAKKQYAARVEQLREIATPAQQKLGELVAAGEDRWHRLEDDSNKVYKAFVHSFNYFKSQLK